MYALREGRATTPSMAAMTMLGLDSGAAPSNATTTYTSPACLHNQRAIRQQRDNSLRLQGLAEAFAQQQNPHAQTVFLPRSGHKATRPLHSTMQCNRSKGACHYQHRYHQQRTT
jgi:hypothetical protein